MARKGLQDYLSASAHGPYDQVGSFSRQPDAREEGGWPIAFLFPGTGPHSLLQEVTQLLLNMSASTRPYGRATIDHITQIQTRRFAPKAVEFSGRWESLPVWPQRQFSTLFQNPWFFINNRNTQAHRQHKGGLDPQ